MQIKPRQNSVIEAINDPGIDTIVLIGAVGTGKTDVAAFAVLSICGAFPKTRWVVVRQNISTAQKTVIPSYLEVADRMNLIQNRHFSYNGQSHVIKFNSNGSEIYFIEADITKDRQGRKIKGINASGNHIDEADELVETMFITATSRKGRRNQAGQPSISIVTMNPNDTYLKEKYYDPFKAGTLPANVRVIEFPIEDSWQTKEDIAALWTNPKWWTERYLNNNWAYADEDQTIFKSEIFARATTDTIKDGGRKSIGYDVAEDGKDRSVAAIWEGLTLVDIKITKDTHEKVKTEKQTEWLIKYSDDHEIGYENVAVDGVGIGVGVLASARQLGVEFDVYKSGFAADPALTFDDFAAPKWETDDQEDMVSYDNLRTQVAYMFALGMEQGKVKILDSCPFRKELILEAQAHHQDTTNKVFKLEPKKKIKERSGKSPDLFDAVVMGLWKQMKKGKKVELGFF